MSKRLNRLPREAVVLVHGIGEQQPLNTLRTFVRSVADDEAVFYAPDDVRHRTDQRKLKVTWRHDRDALASTWGVDRLEQRQANTDFFELYWAYQFRDTGLRHVIGWLWSLLRRKRSTLTGARMLGNPSKWAAAVRKLLGAAAVGVCGIAVVGAWLHSGTLALIAAGSAVALAFASLWLGLQFPVRMLAALGLGGTLAFLTYQLSSTDGEPGGLGRTLGFLGSVGWPLLSAGVATRLSSSLGDAARYLTNSPDNVESNETIRRDAVDLLERLHEAKEVSGRRRYDRIVVVGHSLGSVIAYDAIRYLWASRHKDINLPPESSNDPATAALRKVEEDGVLLAARTDAGSQEFEAAQAEYQRSQWRLFRLLRDIETTPTAGRESTGRWIVSDLVTLGSPLAYSDLLLASSQQNLAQRKAERLLSCCPPVAQESRNATGRPYRYRVTGSDPATRLHHAAAFSAVRWTNLYFDHDVIGGPVAPRLGNGIVDIPLGGGRPMGFILANPHSHYWQPPKSGSNRNSAQTSLDALRRIIRRPPTAYVRLSTPPTAATHRTLIASVTANIGERPLPLVDRIPAPGVDVRVFVTRPGVPREPVWIPAEEAGGAPFDVDAATVTIAWSPDIRPSAELSDDDQEDERQHEED